jgi:serine/threonine-protein phosphatase 5
MAGRILRFTPKSKPLTVPLELTDESLSILMTNRCQTHIYLDRMDRAIADANLALQYNPGNRFALLYRANTHFAARNMHLALNDYSLLADLESIFAPFARNRADLIEKKYGIHPLPQSSGPAPAESVPVTTDVHPLPPTDPHPESDPPPAPESYDNSRPSAEPDSASVEEPRIEVVVPPPPNEVRPSPAVDFANFTADTAKFVMYELKEDRMLCQEIVTEMLLHIRALHEVLPNIVDLTVADIKVVGDTHGQFQDLIYIFEHYGFPSRDHPYLFNGDFVDRGSQGLEIVLTLFSWKIADPESIFLNRGNQFLSFITHSETDVMNAPYGFERECREKQSFEIFRLFSKVFEFLPVGHIINKSVLVVHGGLFRDQTVTIDSLQKMCRFQQPPDFGPMNDILWSDPMDAPGFGPSPRGVTITFGPDITEGFLSQNGLQLLIRSHQVQQNGYLEQHQGKCITVFSAPNYIGRMGNKGAIVVITFGEGNKPLLRFEQFSAQEIPINYRPMKYTNFAGYFL